MTGMRAPLRWGSSLNRTLRGGLLVALAIGGLGCASIAEHQRNVAERSNTSLLERKVWESEAFLRHHPDIKHRKLGFWYQQQGDQERSLRAFQEAARHADKASQAILAEWYFEGKLVAKDLPRAYAFMDLAAERGYPLFTVKREAYWAALDAAQREQALTIGAQLYAEFGDQVAKPRMERSLRIGRMGMTGSRVASPASLQVLVPTGGAWVSLPGTIYYRNHFWRPREYFEWFDALHAAPPHGVVEVGPMAPEVPAAAARSPG
jgi:hypothetical protein